MGSTPRRDPSTDHSAGPDAREACGKTLDERVYDAPVIGVLARFFVITAPVVATLIAGSGWIVPGTVSGSEFVATVAAIAEKLYAFIIGIWLIPAAAWLITHVFRPNDPLCFERVADVLIIASFALYLTALAMALGG